MRLTYDLVPLAHEDYARALRRYMVNVTGSGAVLSVHQFGAVSHPGISDIDLLIVVRDDVTEATLRRLVEAARADHVSRYLFTHPPIVVPRSQAPGIRYIHSLQHLRQLWGDPLDIPPPDEADRSLLEIIDYIDFTFAVRTVLRGLAGSDAGLRSLLLLLQSCVHSLAVAASVLGRPVGAGIAERVAGVRDVSLRNGRGESRQAAAAAAEACVRALREADRDLADRLHAGGLISSAPMREFVCHTDGHFYLFESPFAPAPGSTDGQAPPGGWWRSVGVDPGVETYPAFYLAQFAAYGAGSGLYAATHRAVFGRQAAGLILDGAYRRLLERRLHVVQRTYDVIRRGDLIPMTPLGIGFREPARIRVSRRRRLLKGLVARRVGLARTSRR